MKKVLGYSLLLSILCFCGNVGPLYADEPALPNAAKIEQLTGFKGTFNDKEKVLKVSYPRDDLHGVAAGVKISPAMGLTSWAAFKRVGDLTMVMGEMVVTEDQVNPVMDAALNNGLEVTALYNPFLWETPRVLVMHVHAMGDEGKLAAAVGQVFSTIRDTRGNHSAAARVKIDPAKTTLNPQILSDVLGGQAVLSQGVYTFTFEKATKIDDQDIGAAFGVATWAAFAGSDDQAVVDGDFALYESELQGVLKALRAGGINVVALHNRMTGEVPRVIFLHYWGTGSARDLAKGVKAALEAQLRQ